MQPVLPVLDRRRSGVLLPLSALHGLYPQGVLGAAARHCVDWLASAGFSVWQLLPVGPPGPDGSPYWLRSDMAGDPALIDVAERPAATGAAYVDFCAAQAHWLDDYALFETLHSAQAERPWQQWPAALRDRDSAALAAATRQHAGRIEEIRAQQFAFQQQWHALRRYAADRGVRLFGDLPFYVAPDSAETWMHREQYQLSADGAPQFVAGVPPDYFAADGQLWGNPLYDWDAAQRDGFAHWRARIRQQLDRFDLLRIDHFRALAAHWAVPAAAATARSGRWCPTPGVELLAQLAVDWPALPLVAEDLGEITPDVEALRRRHDLPGMQVLQFAFDGSTDSVHLPHRHAPRSVTYTGTHDNDTLVGWLQSLDGETLRRIEFYFGVHGGQLREVLMRGALGSVAQLAVLPIADVLGLGAEARFNTPGTVSGNWSWKLPPDTLTPALAARFALLNRVFGRSS